MKKDNLFHFGYVLKTQGFKGHVVIAMDVDEPQRYEGLQYIYLETGPDRMEEFGVEEYELNKNRTCTVKLIGIDSFEKAQPLLKKNVWLPLSLLPELNSRSFYFHEIPGYTVIDRATGKVGIAETVIETPQQNILLVRRGKLEVLLPLQPSFIISVDRVNKVLNYDAPEGLIDMYLGKGTDEEE